MPYKYKSENDLVFGGFDLGLVDIRLHGRVKNQQKSKYGRSVFLDIDDYQQGKYDLKPVPLMLGTSLLT